MPASILIADDDLSIREALERSLRFEGFLVSTVENGVLAIAEIEHRIPDILILDINMPEMNGIVATSILKD